jgi:hypothetical protein
MLSKGFEFCDGKSMKMIKMKIANKKILMNLTVLTIHFSIFSCVSFFTINQNISDEDTNRPINFSRCPIELGLPIPLLFENISAAVFKVHRIPE